MKARKGDGGGRGSELQFLPKWGRKVSAGGGIWTNSRVNIEGKIV